MGAAEDLFAKITRKRLDAFITEKREEDLNLDFKTVNAARMDRDDRKNLAIALSGFANADGGVVVWGVDARPIPPEDIDCAQALKPISPLSQFTAKLNEFTGGSVNPTVDGVRHKAIRLKRGADKGFGVSFIPASDAGPHMAKQGHDRYFKRAGGSFVRMEHFDIEDMFGRRKRPVLNLTWKWVRGSTTEGGPRGPAVRGVYIYLLIENSGRGSAAAPYLRVEVIPPFTIYPSGISAGDAPLMPLVEGMKELRCFAGRSSFVVHPGTRYEVARVSVGIPDYPEEFPDSEIRYELAAENFRLVEGRLPISGSKLAESVRRKPV